MASNSTLAGWYRGWTAALATGTLLTMALAAPLATQAQGVQANVSPGEGVRGTRFSFTASGFIADTDTDANENNAEQVAYWINTPDGSVISSDPESEDDKDLIARADAAGQVRLSWLAPADAPLGNYQLVAHGLKSDREVAVSFVLAAATLGEQLPASGTVAPAEGRQGTTFVFSATGFKPNQGGDDDDSNDAEKVAYWINTPDGRVISSDPVKADEDVSIYELKAGRDGRANWQWVAPSDLTPGLYTMVARGEITNREVSISFTIR